MTNTATDTQYQLSCGSYEVYFRNRCGETILCRADTLLKISFNRILNDTSRAEIEVGLRGLDPDCCGCYGSVNPWEHEVSIYRDGVEVWVGPVVEIRFDLKNDRAYFVCRDLSAWLDRRFLELQGEDYDVEGVDSKDVFDYLLNHAYCKDPWCMTWSLTPTGVPITRFYPAYAADERWGGAYPIVGPEMRDLTREGVDFTVVNRHMYGGNLEIAPPLARQPVLLSSHWMELPTVTVSGQYMSTRVAVAGGEGGWDGFYDEEMWIEPPISGPITPDQLTPNQRRYGLLETLDVEPHLYDEFTTEIPNAITQNAFGRFELTSQPFVYIEGGRLAQKAPFTMDDLIPGARYEVRMDETCRLFEGVYRLYEIDVKVEGVDEIVSMRLAPVGVDTLRGSDVGDLA